MRHRKIEFKKGGMTAAFDLHFSLCEKVIPYDFGKLEFKFDLGKPFRLEGRARLYT